MSCNIRNVAGTHDQDVCNANACLESLYDRITKQTSITTYPAYYYVQMVVVPVQQRINS